ncbi:YkvA family protein [Aureibacillus halotolerans]|uniref:Uncharacterized membrane protein YkvA (DUF1232 family) n=1 Tax=Aureibacillus halotolerans TaxID=1508390 RepID=A0A4R6UGF2_9BACI|nr:DUF1232 domain-containing protein [Aureibacillus halotolerans]TDQ42224.1 uncharacterized membrane protein YkvA (DUF1232 family) [Aureibacillus halotolerans]
MRVLNIFRLFSMAKSIFRHKETMVSLVQVVREKQNLKGQPAFLPAMTHKLRLGSDLIMAYVRREYTNVPVKSMIALIAGLLYFAFPLDIIPDFLLPFGLLDDATVLLFVGRTFNNDLKKFEAWKDSQDHSQTAPMKTSHDDLPENDR